MDTPPAAMGPAVGGGLLDRQMAQATVRCEAGPDSCGSPWPTGWRDLGRALVLLVEQRWEEMLCQQLAAPWGQLWGPAQPASSLGFRDIHTSPRDLLG